MLDSLGGVRSWSSGDEDVVIEMKTSANAMTVGFGSIFVIVTVVIDEEMGWFGREEYGSIYILALCHSTHTTSKPFFRAAVRVASVFC